MINFICIALLKTQLQTEQEGENTKRQKISEVIKKGKNPDKEQSYCKNVSL